MTEELSCAVCRRSIDKGNSASFVRRAERGDGAMTLVVRYCPQSRVCLEGAKAIADARAEAFKRGELTPTERERLQTKERGDHE